MALAIFVADKQNYLTMLIQSHTGATAYSGSIESSIARLMFKITWVANVAEADNTKITVSMAGKQYTGTTIPELTVKQLADIAGYIDAMRFDDAAGKTVTFSLPISLGGAFANYDGVITYSISGATAGNTIAVHALDDVKKENDFITITPIGCLAGAVRNISVIDVAFLFVDPSKLTRIKLTYQGGRSVEYLTEELKEISRCVNPIQSMTALGAVTAGFGLLMGLNIVDAVEAEITMSTADNVFLLKHINKA